MNISFDGGDIDDRGHWSLTGVSCLQCREETTACLQLAHPVLWNMYDVVLACVECGEELTPAFDEFSRRAE
jgi:hypothetical protein